MDQLARWLRMSVDTAVEPKVAGMTWDTGTAEGVWISGIWVAVGCDRTNPVEEGTLVPGRAAGGSASMVTPPPRLIAPVRVPELKMMCEPSAVRSLFGALAVSVPAMPKKILPLFGVCGTTLVGALPATGFVGTAPIVIVMFPC